jgi:hypothetical protein
MGQVFTAFFAFIIQLFSAAEKMASSINNVATWADESTATFTDEARHNRQVRIKAMMAEEGISELPKAERKTVAAPKIK